MARRLLRTVRTVLFVLVALAPIPVAVAVTRSGGDAGDATRRSMPVEASAVPPASTAPTCTPDASLTAPAVSVPPDVAVAVDRFAADPAVASGPFGVSIWIDGYGEIARQPDLPLLPASNQKLLTAMGALAVLGPDARFTTEVLRTAEDALVLVGGGDPSLAAQGPDSLDALAAQVRAAGITRVSGPLLTDESRHDSARRAAGWEDWQVPEYVGPLSALMVDRNRYRRDPDFLADPALANTDLFRSLLAAHGVVVDGPTAHGTASPGAATLASVTSSPVAALLAETLMRSDNMAAEELLREVGHATRGAGASTADGAAASRAALAPLCVPVAGVDDDGSGISRANARSTREWRVLLQAARTQPWWPLLFDALPVAGRSGTLAARFRGTPAEANVRAKTGTIIGGIALSGYGTTVGGRAFVFSVIANGPAANGAEGALDALVASVAADQS